MRANRFHFYVQLAASLFAGLICSLAVAFARDWPSFRGPDRSGVSKETGLLQKWPDGGPALVWDIAGTGRGYASVAVVGDRIYTLGDNTSIAEDSDEYLMAFDRESGKPLWQTKTGAPWNSGQANWQSSRSTPTVDGDRIYVLTAHGELVCCDSKTGKEHWRKSMQKDFGGKKGDGWGYSESPLIDGDRLICTPGGEEATMVALNKNNGELIWKASRPGDKGAGHASIVPAKVGSTRVYVQSTGSGPLGIRADDGKLLWTYDIPKTTAVIPTPIVRDDLVFFTAGYGCGGALLRQVQSDGDVKIEEVYPLNKALMSKHGGVVLVGDYLYGGRDGSPVIFCAEFMTGEIKWEHRGSGSGSAAVAAGDGDLYIHFENGTMSLVKADAEEYVEVGSFTVPGSGERPSWAHPVIADGKLFVREQDHILCYSIASGRQ